MIQVNIFFFYSYQEIEADIYKITSPIIPPSNFLYVLLLQGNGSLRTPQFHFILFNIPYDLVMFSNFCFTEERMMIHVNFFIIVFKKMEAVTEKINPLLAPSSTLHVFFSEYLSECPCFC